MIQQHCMISGWRMRYKFPYQGINIYVFIYFMNLLLKSIGVEATCFLKYLIKLVGSSNPNSNPISLIELVVWANNLLASNTTLSSIKTLGDFPSTFKVDLFNFLSDTAIIAA